MNTLFLTLTVINFIFIFDIIFFNSKLSKKLKKTVEEYIPGFIKKIKSNFKIWLYRKIYAKNEIEKEYQVDEYKVIFGSQEDLDQKKYFEDQKEILSKMLDSYSHLKIKHYFTDELLIQVISDQITSLTSNEFYLVEGVIKELKKIDEEDTNAENYTLTVRAHLTSANTLLSNFKNIQENYKNAMQNFYSKANNAILEELFKFRKLNEIYKNAKTSKVFLNAERKYSVAFYLYTGFAFFSMAAALHFSLYSLSQKKVFMESYSVDIYDYWTLKITGIFIFITLITYFIKQASHYQKKKDQAERTRLELDALPTYIFDFKNDEIKSIRKELIPKYFGNSNDNSTLNEIGNIINEQLKSSTEVAKSSAEVIKALTPPKK
ncbi:hypothetical protein [Acinetobacter bereziniae]|uniref:hypothetical protein n=1 Tax=Acinetobacter bereziniae TaxID=106648 RepID=UPI003570FE76